MFIVNYVRRFNGATKDDTHRMQTLVTSKNDAYKLVNAWNRSSVNYRMLYTYYIRDIKPFSGTGSEDIKWLQDDYSQVFYCNMKKERF